MQISTMTEKIRKVYRSCETMEQYNLASIWCDLYIKKIKRDHYNIYIKYKEHIELIIKLTKIIQRAKCSIKYVV